MNKNISFFLALTVGLTLALLLLLPLITGQASPENETYTVTRTDDPVPDACLLNDCSLREAILSANAHPGLDYVGLTIDTTYLLSIPADENNEADTGDLNITDSLTFFYPNMICLGDNCRATIKGAGSFLDRILHLDHAAEVVMFGLTILDGSTSGDGGGILIETGSRLFLRNCVVLSSVADGDGGGVMNKGYLSLDDTIISDNAASYGGGIYNDIGAHLVVVTPSWIVGNTIYGSGSGGGLWLLRPATAQLSYLEVRDNHADNGLGGGIYAGNQDDELHLTHMRVLTNTALDGGGIYLTEGTLRFTQGIISENTASDKGGGVSAMNYQNSRLIISHTTISDNTAEYGGGIGVAWDSTAMITMTNVTVSGNRANDNGGGLALSYGWLYNVTITNNTSDADFNQIGLGGGLYVGKEVTLANTALGANPRGFDCYQGSSATAIHSLDYNLIQQTGNCTLTGDIFHNKLGFDPLLAPLADNGGETFTHLPLAGSPLDEAGNPFGCKGADNLDLTSDQRGWSRPVGLCEIGALEIDALPDTFPPETMFGPLPLAGDPTPTFFFDADDGTGVGVEKIECQVDGGAWFLCTSPYTSPELPEGDHTFSARASDLLGNVDPTPATHTWTLEIVYSVWLPLITRAP